MCVSGKKRERDVQHLIFQKHMKNNHSKNTTRQKKQTAKGYTNTNTRNKHHIIPVEF